MCTSTLGASIPGHLGGIVRRRREQLGLSIREAARRIGISPSYLAVVEQGRNPSTGRAPTPSLRILTAMARVLQLEPVMVLDVAGAPTSSSSHLLLYQTDADRSPLEAARGLFAGDVDAWIEMVDPRIAAGSEKPPDDVLVRRRQPLASPAPQPHVFETPRVLAALSDAIAEARRSSPDLRVGVIFGASSAVLRSVDNPAAVLESEATWEDDITGLGIEFAASVCVYREADIEELAPRLDPLRTVLSLVQSHPHVAIEDRSGALTTGPAAIETILVAARPAGVGSETWESIAHASAVGLAHAARTDASDGGDGEEP